MEPDRPISNSAEDLFGRKHFAHRVAEIIAARDPQSGIVIGIHAPWGEGKTSVLNMIVEKLKTYQEVLVIHFNPWRFPDEASLLRGFFMDIAGQLNTPLVTKGEKGFAIAEEYADVLSSVPYSASVISVVKKLARKRTSVGVDELKIRFRNALEASSKRVVIMMDDIDRLDKSEIQTVFRLVKLLADFPNTTYVLFFDEKRVSEALGERYGADGGGRNFLEKIIQVPLFLPPVTKQARRAIAIEGLQAALALAKITLSDDDGRRLGEIFDKAFLNRITTPRLAKRFGNALIFALPILFREVDIVDLILIEAIRILYPEVYMVIRDHPDVFLGRVSDRLSGMNESEATAHSEQVITAALESYSEDDQRAASLAIHALFPRSTVTRALKVIPYSVFDERGPRERRIAAKEYYPRYFNYGVPLDDISDQDIEKFLARIPGDELHTLIEEFKNLSSNNRAHVLIEKLRRREDRVHPETAAILAVVVALSGDAMPYNHPTDRFFGLGAYSQASALIRHLLKRIEDAAPRDDLAIEIAQRIEPIPFAFDYSSWIRPMKRSDESGDTVSLVSAETETQIRQIIVQKIASLVEREPLERRYPYDAQQLYQLWAFVNKQQLRDYLAKRIAVNVGEAAEFISAANGLDPLSETPDDWREDVGWFGFICDLISPRQVMQALLASYPQLTSADYNPPKSEPMNNRERAARWFQRLYERQLGETEGHPKNGAAETSEPASQTSVPDLEPVFEHALISRSIKRKQYLLKLSIKNNGPKPTVNYYIEVEFPSVFLQKEWHPAFEESGRQTAEHRFFRMTDNLYSGGTTKWKLYVGDKRELLTLNYFVDETNHMSQILSQKLRVTIFYRDTIIHTVERPMSDFVDLENSE